MNPKIALPITLALIYRSYSHSSLTLPGILAATLTALIHALHPSPIPFTLLVTFFLLGTTATKVKKDIKASLTLSSTGHRTFGSSSRVQDWFGPGWNKHKPLERTTSNESTRKSSSANGNPSTSTSTPTPTPTPSSISTGGQEPRSATQVLANSISSSLLCLLHITLYGTTSHSSTSPLPSCFGIPTTPTSLSRDILLLGIISNYASVTADTLSSELGILSHTRPRHILTFRTVPPGTNGGITGAGLFSGLAGALIIGLVSVALLPDLWNWSVCSKIAGTGSGNGIGGGTELATGERAAELLALVLAVGSWGALGSVLDSILGATLQASVIDRRSGKVVEATNGGRVLVSSSAGSGAAAAAVKGNPSLGSRVVGTGRDILDNNQVNLLMAGVMTVGGMVVGCRFLGVEFGEVFGR